MMREHPSSLIQAWWMSVAWDAVSRRRQTCESLWISRSRSRSRSRTIQNPRSPVLDLILLQLFPLEQIHLWVVQADHAGDLLGLQFHRMTATVMVGMSRGSVRCRGSFHQGHEAHTLQQTWGTRVRHDADPLMPSASCFAHVDHRGHALTCCGQTWCDARTFHNTGHVVSSFRLAPAPSEPERATCERAKCERGRDQGWWSEMTSSAHAGEPTRLHGKLETGMAQRSS